MLRKDHARSWVILGQKFYSCCQNKDNPKIIYNIGITNIIIPSAAETMNQYSTNTQLKLQT